MAPESPQRDYRRLLESIHTLIRVLERDAGEDVALRTSFAEAARGFGAENALLLVVERKEPLGLKAVEIRGSLTPSQIAACEKGESVKGVSPSVIRQVIETGRSELVRDPRLHSEAAGTTSLLGANYSVLCAPVVDAVGQGVRGVLYFQNNGVADAYEADDLVWLEGYAAALGSVVGYHLDQHRRRAEIADGAGRPEAGEDAPDIVGESAHIQELRRLLHEVYIPAFDAETPDPILIVGERGTGKDLVARYIHAYSSRRNKPLVVVNCAEITDEMAPSRFFGHKRGSFTSALQDEAGFFRAAHGGILFLDEIGDLSTRAQACLLRVLENHTVVPVGHTQETRVDVAVLLATNRDLRSLAEEGVLRRDFYDRFRTQVIPLGSLRERPWDIPALLEHFRHLHERRSRKKTLGFTPEAIRALVSFGWPGNVRDVARVCSLLVTHARPGARIDVELLRRCYPEALEGTANPEAGPLIWEGASLGDAVRAFERELILARLERHQGNVRAARESLGLTKTTFHRHLRSLGVDAGRFRERGDPAEE